MRQYSSKVKCGAASANEYVQAEENNNVKSSIAEQEQQRVEQVEFKSCGNKEVKVTLIFPAASDGKAEEEFTSRLKEIYLRKIEAGAMQEREDALQCQSTDRSVILSHTKEDKSHE